MFVILWHFEVKPGNQVPFENAYGPNGAWVQIFRRDPHYRGTQLLHDSSQAGGYFTLDFWESETAYRTFLTVQQRAYHDLDVSLQGLTGNERHILSFELDPAITRP